MDRDRLEAATNEYIRFKDILDKLLDRLSAPACSPEESHTIRSSPVYRHCFAATRVLAREQMHLLGVTETGDAGSDADLLGWTPAESAELAARVPHWYNPDLRAYTAPKTSTSE